MNYNTQICEICCTVQNNCRKYKIIYFLLPALT